MAALMPLGKQQYFAASGAPLVGGKVYTYAAGTTTPLATYTDSSGSTPNANPVVLDSRGEASIFFSATSYKIVLKDSADVTIWTQDNLAGDAAASALASALAALAASGGSALVGFLQSGTGAVATTVQTKLRESVSVKDFGAVGDGVTDDTAAIQAAIDHFGSLSGTLYFPTGIYRITDSLNFGIWSIAGNGNVLGFAHVKNGLRIVGELDGRPGETKAKILWDGGLQLGNNAVTQSDTVGTYTYITNAKAMIHTVGGYGLCFEGITLDGNNQAYAGVFFDGLFYKHSYEKALIQNCRVGMQIAMQIRHDTYAQYWGYWDSPYFKNNVFNAIAVGGAQCDTVRVANMQFSNCQDAISTESAQALSMIYENIWIVNTASAMPNWTPTSGVLNIGGRLNLRGVGVGGDLLYSIWHLSNSSDIEVQEFHDESSSTYSYQGTTTAGAIGRVIFHSGDCKGINFPSGDGIATLTNISISGPILRTGDSSAAYKFSLSLRDVKSTYAGNLIGLGTVADKTNVLVDTANVLLPSGGNLFAGYGNFFVGNIGPTSPQSIFISYQGRVNKDAYVLEKTNQIVQFDGYATKISGKKTSLPDATDTTIGTFVPGTSQFYKVTMNVLLQTGPSATMGALSKQIAFSIGKTSSGTYYASAVTEVSSYVAGNLTGFTATYSLSIVAGGIELHVTPDTNPNLTSVLTFSAELIGGYNGGDSANIFTVA